MGEVRKKPRVIQDLIDLATYIGEDNLEVSDRFLFAAEETFKRNYYPTAFFISIYYTVSCINFV